MWCADHLDAAAWNNNAVARATVYAFVSIGECVLNLGRPGPNFLLQLVFEAIVLPHQVQTLLQANTIATTDITFRASSKENVCPTMYSESRCLTTQ